jgi:hypothetical protein
MDTIHPEAFTYSASQIRELQLKLHFTILARYHSSNGTVILPTIDEVLRVIKDTFTR